MEMRWIWAFISLLSVSFAATVRGRLDLGPQLNITRATVSRVHFWLHQIGNYSEGHGYSSETQLNDLDGNFQFENIPLNPGLNATTHFVMYSSSMDFNLKPNRILITFTNLDEQGEAYDVKAHRNVFGKEFFPSPDIAYPEELEQIEVSPYIKIAPISAAPMRVYYQQRNKGILQSGPLAKLFDTRWKQAGVITLIALVVFPIVLEKLDPETAKAVKEEQQRRQRLKYAAKEE
ncbi:hypothetical protein HG536_0G01760 [Torulaspora globosa]|uniref:Protein SOP4 n=1 Tax=Torulaspora globosa TaxID=48254 RepID=A0A7G3ZLD1_9SACH|nr:uncharacterized protein HG536_0G01760 [Torulaspora globosa]QLL34317.1 hypothetical protein HG536_0G01760 [Torulaspora globosa]